MCSATSHPPAEPRPAGGPSKTERRQRARRQPPDIALCQLAVNAALQEKRGRARGSRSQESNGTAQLKSLARVVDNVMHLTFAARFQRWAREAVDEHMPASYDLSGTWPRNAATPAWLVRSAEVLAARLPAFEVTADGFAGSETEDEA